MDPIHKQKVSRKQFLTYAGGTILALTGIGSFIGVLKGEHRTVSVPKGVYELASNRGKPGGYAPLNSSGKIPLAFLPANTATTPNLTSLGNVKISSPSRQQVLTYNALTSSWTNQALPITSVNSKTGDVVLTANDLGAYVKPGSGIPASDLTTSIQMTLSDAGSAVQSVNGKTGSSISLTASDVGAPTALAGDSDVSITSPTNGQALVYDTSSNSWTNEAIPSAPVSSVNAKTGTVVLSASDVGAVPTTETGAANGVATLDSGTHLTASQVPPTVALLASPVLTGTPEAPTASPLSNDTLIATTAYADDAVLVETERAEGVEAGTLAKASNLADVASPVVALQNLGMQPSGDVTGATDSAMLTAAALMGASVTLKSGTFYIDAGTSPLPANFACKGAGKHLTTIVTVGAGPFIPFVIENVSNVQLWDLTINCASMSSSSVSNGMGVYVLATTTNMTGIDLRRVEVINAPKRGISIVGTGANTIGGKFVDLTTTTTGDIGIYCSQLLAARFIRPTATGATSSGMDIAASSDVWVIDGTTTGNGSGVNRDGLAFGTCSNFKVIGGNYSFNLYGYGIAVSVGCTDFTINCPTTESNLNGGIAVDVNDGTDTSGTATSGSVTTLVNSGAAWTVNQYAGYQLTITSGTGAGQYVTVISNTASILTFAAITTAPDNTSHYSLAKIYAVNGTITGCKIANNTQQGVWGNYCSGVTVVGNEICGNGLIAVDVNAQNWLISGNDVHDNGTGVQFDQGSGSTGDAMGGHVTSGNSYRNNSIANIRYTSPAPIIPCDIRDFLAAGQINVGTGNGITEQLSIGTTGQVLTVAAGLPSWASPGGATETTRNTSTLPASAVGSEATVLTGSTAGGTLTLPTTTLGTPNIVQNNSSVAVTVAAPGGTTMNNNGVAGSIVVDGGVSYSFALVGTVWYVVSTTFAPDPAAVEGYLAWSYDPVGAVTNTILPAAATVYGMKIRLLRGLSVTNIVVALGAYGTVLTDAFVSLWNSAGVQIGQSADQSTAWETGGDSLGNVAVALASGPFYCPLLRANDFLYAGIYVGTATTLPKFEGVSSSPADINFRSFNKAITNTAALGNISGLGGYGGCLWLALD